MKLAIFLALGSLSALAQQQPQPSAQFDPNAPPLKLQDKIDLTTDDVKISDSLETYQKKYLAIIKPFQDDQTKLKERIEKDNAGWILVHDQQFGWHLIKKAEPPKPEKK